MPAFTPNTTSDGWRSPYPSLSHSPNSPTYRRTRDALPRIRRRHIPLQRDPRDAPAVGDELGRSVVPTIVTLWRVVKVSSRGVEFDRVQAGIRRRSLSLTQWRRRMAGTRVLHLAEPQVETVAVAAKRWGR